MSDSILGLQLFPTEEDAAPCVSCASCLSNVSVGSGVGVGTTD